MMFGNGVTRRQFARKFCRVLKMVRHLWCLHRSVPHVKDGHTTRGGTYFGEPRITKRGRHFHSNVLTKWTSFACKAVERIRSILNVLLEDWKTAHIQTMYKKWSKNLYSSYRGTSIRGKCRKLYSCVTFSHRNLKRKNQNGFCFGFVTFHFIYSISANDVDGVGVHVCVSW